MNISLNTNKSIYLNYPYNKNATSFKGQHDIDLFIKENPVKKDVKTKEHSYFSKFIANKKLSKGFKQEGLFDNDYMYRLLKNDVEEAIGLNPVEALKKFEIIKAYPDFKHSKYNYIRTFLSDENITAQVVKDLFELGEYVHKNYRPVEFFKILKSYENFHSQSTVINSQNEFISDLENFEKDYFNIGVLNNIDENSELAQYSFIKDVKKTKSIDTIIDRLKAKMTNSYVDAIPVDKIALQNLDRAFGYSNLYETLNSLDLSFYSEGLPLLHSREYFISHFKDSIKNLSKDEQQQVYKYFNFYINKDDDIIHYPSLPKNKIDSNSKEVNASVDRCKKLIKDYMYENRVLVPQKHYKLGIFMDTIIKAFPEFIPQIGKVQHRGDTMDYHVLDNLKRIVNNPMYPYLRMNERKILAYATLFHDFSKPEGEKDKEHPFKSANYANDILKKTELNNDDKERIYNLIRYSHWMTDNSLDAQDIAVRFRRPNDFQMAEIFAKADCESAVFNYPVDAQKVSDIKFNLYKINEMAIPLFADAFPQEIKCFDGTYEGIKYLDFSDLDKDVSKYGFKEGTKVRDLSFLFHSFKDLPNLDLISDITKEACLSTTFLPFERVNNIRYNGAFNKVIVSASNSNIALAGKNVSATGKKKNINDFADFVLKNDYKADLFFRHEFSSYIKRKLGLSAYQYAQLYEYIGNLSSLDDIKHINLFDNKHLLKDEVVDAIKYAQDKIVYPIDIADSYANEVVVLNPKIEAFVLPKDFFFAKKSEVNEKSKISTYEKIKEICLERDIPVVLV